HPSGAGLLLDRLGVGRVHGWLVSPYLLALPGLLAVAWITNTLYRVSGAEAPTQGVIESLEALSGLRLAGLALVAVFLQPILEETLFRGYLWRFLAGREDFGPRRALLFSSLAFALAHERGAWLPAFYLGLLFGWVRWRTGRTRYAAMIHVLHNGLVTVWVLLPFTSGVTL
ncbi:MAG: lysostaphin resistance A-like protein, partial [Planctomycetota bacterium]